MIDEQITVPLPAPWTQGKFETEVIGSINYLVGPNGSGKSRFAAELLSQLNSRPGGARLLGTDRLREMADPGAVGRYWGDHFLSGYAKSSFGQLRQAGAEGSGIDTILLLEDRMDLRIQIEATLSHFFDRDVVFDWDAGNLVPKATHRKGGESYRLDRDECHGIKELFVLLTHLYDHQHRYLIIDEPELNLHPQYQAFFMQEVRKVAGRPASSSDNKVVFLITHSPFILDLRLEDDIKSVISFDLDYSIPRQVASTTPEVSSAVVATGRLNAHHKQLFFSDNPVFVEGHHDTLIVEALMEARGVSAAAEGSCILDCGGVEDVNRYLKLCQGLGKEAHFVYDLDSLFRGRLRSCIGDDNSIRNFLASAGVGPSFGTYVGELDQRLTDLIDLLLRQSLCGHLEALGRFFAKFPASRKKWDNGQLAKARVATMTMVSQHRDEIVPLVEKHTVEDIEGRWKKILAILAEKNIHVLPGGALERYLPCFTGDLLDPKPGAKGNAVVAELKKLQRIRESNDSSRETTLVDRYGELYGVVRNLPSKAQVDCDGVLRRHLSDYVHELQKIVEANTDWEKAQIEGHMCDHPLPKSGIVSLKRFERGADGRFNATISISEILGKGRRCVEVNADTTIRNMPALRQEEPDSTVT